MRRFLLLFLSFSVLSLALLSLQNGFTDPDGFYHAKMAQLIWQQHSPVHTFPWLDLTLFSQHFADLHFLYHLLLAPFVGLIGFFHGMTLGTAMFAGLTAALFDLCLKKLNKSSIFWIILLFSTPDFLWRISMQKASALAISIFLCGLIAAWLRRPKWCFLLAFLYILTHAGWILLPFSLVILECGDFLFSRFIDEKSWSDMLKTSRWRELIAILLGLTFGLLLHPNSSQLLQLTWTQVISIGAATPYNIVNLGKEWYPTTPIAMLASYATAIIFLLLGSLGLLIARKPGFNRDHGRALLAWTLLSGTFFVLTLKSVRMTEYFAPLLVITLTFLWSFIDQKELLNQAKKTLSMVPKKLQKPLVFFLILLLTSEILNGLLRVATRLHQSPYPEDLYRSSMATITQIAHPGDRVFHTSWDEFPLLFTADDRLKYISGLDPTFYYLAQPSLSVHQDDIVLGRHTSSTPDSVWRLVTQDIPSQFIFISKKPQHQAFLDIISKDPRYHLLKEDKDSAAYKIR